MATVPGIEKIGIVGAGNMGHQIALCAAMAGYRVCCTDVSQDVLSNAEQFTQSYLTGRVTKGKLTQEAAAAVRGRMAFVPALEEIAVDADLVIEAVVENLDVKRQVFAELDRLCPSGAILATNSSFIVSSKIADATLRPSQVINMHFFNPALVMKVVEVVQGPHAADSTATRVVAVAKSFDKIPIVLKKESYGFLVNRLLSAFLEEALAVYDQGIASYEDIDIAVTHALGHPMGPFQLIDLAGIDLHYGANLERYRETGDPSDRPSPAIVERYVKGEWGRKSGKGFYIYQESNA